MVVELLGATTPLRATPLPILRRFFSNVRISEPDACWEWIGSKYTVGYGQFSIPVDGRNRTMVGAHRFAWALAFGKTPKGMFVCHHCDNPPCVRPDHLFLGTHTENIRDMLRKGRGRWRQQKSRA